MARHLGIDIGGSAARWLLAAGDAPARRGAAGGFSGHLYRPEVRTAAEASLAAIAAAVGSADAIVAGVTGLTSGTREAEALRAMIAKAFAASRVEMMGDARLACLSVFAPGEGHLVYAGTGSIAAHVAADGALTLVGGKGVVIDDSGGGHWIAAQALRSVLRREDAEPGSAWATPLGRALSGRVGGSDWPLVRQAVYGGDRGAVALLALAAGEAAAMGDPVAVAILQEAGRELAALALALERRIGARPIVLGGRAAALHAALFESFAAELPGRDVRLVEIDAAAGAARLAAELTAS